LFITITAVGRGTELLGLVKKCDMIIYVCLIKAWKKRRESFLLGTTRKAIENNGIDISTLWKIKDNFIVFKVLTAARFSQ